MYIFVLCKGMFSAFDKLLLQTVRDKSILQNIKNNNLYVLPMKKRIFEIVIVVCFFLAIPLTSCGKKGNNDSIRQIQTDNGTWSLIWDEEFNYSGLPDATKWSYDTQGNASGWGNNEAQYYTTADSSNAWVENGLLTITAHKDTIGNKKYTSARLITKGKGDWLYGRLEICAKLPTGRGTWPAIWMLPTDWAYGGWPASGEIDIMENVGFMPDSIFGSAHTKTYNHVLGTQKTKGIYCPTCYSDFHVYALEWGPDEYRLYVDNQHYFTFQNEKTGPNEYPFDKRFHLLLNLAVGGNWGGKFGVDESILPLHFYIDYVRVYAQKNTLGKN